MNGSDFYYLLLASVYDISFMQKKAGLLKARLRSIY